MDTYAYSSADILKDERAILRRAVEETVLLREILEGLKPEDRVNLLQARLNSCEDCFLHFALRVGSSDAVKCVLSLISQQGTAVVFLLLKTQNIHGDTAMHIAVQKGNVEALDVMLKAADRADRLRLLLLQDKRSRKIELYDGGDPSSHLIISTKDCSVENFATALHMAASSGNEEVIKTMLTCLDSPDERYLLLSMQNTFGFTALHCAVKEDHVRCISALLEGLSESQVEAILMITDVWGSTAVHKPSKKASNPIRPTTDSNELWELADPSKREDLLQIPSLRKTAMLTTIQNDAGAVTFEAILRRWADPSFAGKPISIPRDLGDSAIKLAFNMQHLECFHTLLVLLEPTARLAFFKRMTNKQWGDTLLHITIDENQHRFLQCLVEVLNIESRMKFLRECGKNGDTSLHRAATKSRTDFMSTILTSVDLTGRVDLLEMENKLGNTPLSIVVHRDNLELLLVILKSLHGIGKFIDDSSL